jgi:hypothetical protein
MKTIVNFRDEPHGFFVDLEGGGKIGINRRTGEILLREGRGEDRFDGAVLSPEAFGSFAIRRCGNSEQWELILRFGRRKAHNLGRFSDFQNAEAWVNAATRAIRSVLPEPERDDHQGIKRVSRTLKTGERSEYWQVRWRDEKQVLRTAKFSINRYGVEKSRELALRAMQRANTEVASHLSISGEPKFEVTSAKKLHELLRSSD